MAYFDDPKLREKWEESLVPLREERARRLSGEAPQKVEGFAHQPGLSERTPVSYAQLLQEEHLARTGKVLQNPAPALNLGKAMERPLEAAPVMGR